MVTSDRQIHRGGVNMPATSTAREDSFCAHAILHPDRPLIVEDTLADRRFIDSLMVVERTFALRFYAGMPVRLLDGQPVGALFVTDKVPGAFSDSQVAVLRGLAETLQGIVRLARPAASARETLLQELRRAAAYSPFTLQWQPITRTDSLETYGHEALIRWTRANGVPTLPDDFIPLAESSGMISKIDRAVLWAACAEMAARRDHRRVSINVSTRWFGLPRPMLPRLISRILDKTGLSPDRLTIELTERVLMNADRALREMRELKELGIHLALDDFGTGYSSLSYLEAFPFDLVKMDKAFVAGLGTNARSETIVKAVIRLGHDLGMMLCAEGVETERQLAFLRDQRCDLVQGYLLGRPGQALP